MERTTFRIALDRAEWSRDGADRVSFLVSPNLCEEPRPLEKVASGGEISRIALALKTCLAAPRAKAIRTLVFDEVDTGVGGGAAEGVGRRLKKLAAANQVLCVTHLPQVAATASSHFVVTKDVTRGRTFSNLREVTGKVRQEEIARMLGGKSESALKLAASLLK